MTLCYDGGLVAQVCTPLSALIFLPQLVVFLPALCRKMAVPYMIVKGKARLGQVVHKKTATCLALTGVSAADKPALQRIIESANTNFSDRHDEISKRWGTKVMGAKTQIAVQRAEAKKAKEALAKYG
jgi:large subunit ribosomal protein L7Ae